MCPFRFFWHFDSKIKYWKWGFDGLLGIIGSFTLCSIIFCYRFIFLLFLFDDRGYFLRTLCLILRYWCYILFFNLWSLIFKRSNWGRIFLDWSLWQILNIWFSWWIYIICWIPRQKIWRLIMMYWCIYFLWTLIW